MMQACPYRLPQGNCVSLTACRKQAGAAAPLPLASPYREFTKWGLVKGGLAIHVLLL